MRKTAIETLLVTILGVLIAMGIAVAAGGAYLKWSTY